MEIGCVLELCNEINNRLNTVVEIIDYNDELLSENIKEVEIESANLKNEMQNKLNMQIQNDLTSLDKYLNDLLSKTTGNNQDILLKCKNNLNMHDYDSQLSSCEDETSKLILEKENLYNIVTKINQIQKELNLISFDIVNPPLNVKILEDTILVKKGDTESLYDLKSSKITVKDIDSRPDKDKLSSLFSEIIRAKRILLDIEKTFKNIMNVNTYFQYIDQSKEMWIDEETSAINSEKSSAINDSLIKETPELNKSTFTNIEQEGVDFQSDLICGSENFSKAITIGKLSVNVTENPRYLALIKESPLLNSYVADGKLNVPLVLDLKHNGNIWLNIHEMKFEPDTFNFIHQIIIQFLLAFPAGRLNLCLVDVDDKGEFSKYTKLTAINNRILCDGIVREARSLGEVLMNLEKTMHDIFDNKLSFNDCEDFYQYNIIAESNPQSATLLVLLNYPKGVKEEENNRLLKLMENGNRSGIFTFIVNNTSCDLPIGVKEEDYNQMVKKLSQSALVINKNGNDFTTSTSIDHRYLPNYEISYELLPKIITLLTKKAKEGLRVVIPLKDMFNEIDKLDDRNSILPVSEVIDLPIGKRGGELQNILFDATGEGSAHAVVIGGTGSGKSNLLHTMIMSACYKYSPDDLQIYLVDFKGGVEFKFYEANKDISRQLPHIKLTGLTSEPEDGVAILSNVRKELRFRENLFREHSVEDIVQFRRKYPDEKIARLLILIDEVQELFERDDKLGQEAIDILSELFKKGRAFGISILWASQNVPKVPGLKDKILSQIGNRVSLRLNNPEDASDINIDPKKIQNLNRPEKGLAIISDIRTAGDNIEFRVAYAYNSEDRYSFTSEINKKWEQVTESWGVREPLFIVGNDETPLPNKCETKYTTWSNCSQPNSKLSLFYSLNLGQDYITGKSFEINLGLRQSRANIWLAGSNMSEIRDIIGYALLSVIIDNVNSSPTNSQNIYYINGEYKDPEDPRDLYYVLPELFKDHISELKSADELIEIMRKLYLIRKERSSNIQQSYSPVFIFIHKLQAFIELFRSNNMIEINKPYVKENRSTDQSISKSSGDMPAALAQYIASPSPSAIMGISEKSTFNEMFKELFMRGSDVGIHFVVSMDSPQSVREIMSELRECSNKIILKGVSPATLTNVLDTYKGVNSLNKEGIAFSYLNGELYKFKPYRYDSKTDEKWLLELRNELKDKHELGDKHD